MKKFKLFINNKWVDSSDGKTFIAYNPSTGEELAELALAGKKDVDKAVKAAKAAAPAWKNTDGDTRANLMMKALDIMKRRHKELA
jgi:aldehyde dehydrogenase (NAD+)